MTSSYLPLTCDEEGAERLPSKRSCLVLVAASLSIVLLLGIFHERSIREMPQTASMQGMAKATPAPAALMGWSKERWVECTTVPQHCPLKSLDFPSTGCISTLPLNRLLLTGDGLSSPKARSSFQNILQSTVEAAGEGRSKDKRVLNVLDAAHYAFLAGSQLMSAEQYCKMRTAELTSLGASAVVCVLLDPNARRDVWKQGQAEGGEAKAFGDFVFKMGDDEIFRELKRANAIWVEPGSPAILTKNMKRSLSLSEPFRKLSSGSESPATMKHLIRSRVQDPSGGLAYFGVSTGSSLAGTFMIDLYPHAIKELGGDNSGLDLVSNCSFFPHTDSLSSRPMLHQLHQQYGTNVMGVPDCQSVVNTEAAAGQLSHICP